MGIFDIWEKLNGDSLIFFLIIVSNKIFVLKTFRSGKSFALFFIRSKIQVSLIDNVTFW